MTTLPSLHAIRAFEAAARLGGFASAAKELGTSAAAVSYHVRQLERQTGLTLFRRLAHRVEITDAGMLLATEATAAFQGLRTSFARAAAVDDGCLSVTALPTFGTSWLTPRLGAFRSAHPDIQLEIDLSPEAQDLSSGRFDVAIRNGFGHWPGLDAIFLFPSIFIPMCAPHLLRAAEKLTINPDDVALPFLGRQDWWSIWFKAAGHNSPVAAERFGIRLADEHLDAAAAIAGHGITIGSPILFRHDIDAGRLAPIGDMAAADGRSFWLVYPRVRRESTKIVHFREWLSAEARAASAASEPWLAGAIAQAEAHNPGRYQPR